MASPQATPRLPCLKPNKKFFADDVCNFKFSWRCPGRKEQSMLKLYKWDQKRKKFILKDYGVESKADVYAQLGYIVEFALSKKAKPSLAR
jgi:hypothetical protein